MSRNNTYRALRTAFISAHLQYTKGSFAHLTTRKNANRYLLATKDFKARKEGELYILDEVYGKYSKNEKYYGGAFRLRNSKISRFLFIFNFFQTEFQFVSFYGNIPRLSKTSIN